MPYKCIHCTYEHYYAVERCKMCGRIQFSNSDISNFVQGKETSKRQQLNRMSDGRATTPPLEQPQRQTTLKPLDINEDQRRRMAENRRKAEERVSALGGGWVGRHFRRHVARNSSPRSQPTPHTEEGKAEEGEAETRGTAQQTECSTSAVGEGDAVKVDSEPK